MPENVVMSIAYADFGQGSGEGVGLEWLAILGAKWNWATRIFLGGNFDNESTQLSKINVEGFTFCLVTLSFTLQEQPTVVFPHPSTLDKILTGEFIREDVYEASTCQQL